MSTLEKFYAESVKLSTFCGNLEVSVYETRLHTVRAQSQFLDCGWENADVPHERRALRRTGLDPH